MGLLKKENDLLDTNDLLIVFDDEKRTSDINAVTAVDGMPSLLPGFIKYHCKIARSQTAKKAGIFSIERPAGL
ncbi:hypothetical protein [Lentibacillus cibarius]|uniref:hypothetical protein n=1 Tax=Lentibacillus cibarius TaxID=2583219 RepID=UPI001F1F7A4C|nr:hypothetical protein [Lentibacillus cibarius]